MLEEFIIASDYGMLQIQHAKLKGRDLSSSLGLARFALKGVRKLEQDLDNGIITVEYDEIKTSKEELILKAENLLAKHLA